jgi:dTDP-glucose 4,6-dehydratase
MVSANQHPLTLVTGGAGFLGSHLCDRLVGEGHEVVCLDNLITGRIENIKHLVGHPRFRFVHHDVTHPIDLPALLWKSAGQPSFSPRQVSYILHFASPASPKDYARHPIHTLKVGALGTYHALGLAKADGSVFLLASTSEVYGDPEVSPQPEEYWGHVNPIGPRSVYDEAKRYAEAISMAYCREHGVKVRIARIFNTYGERDDNLSAVASLLQAAKLPRLTWPLMVFSFGLATMLVAHQTAARRRSPSSSPCG